RASHRRRDARRDDGAATRARDGNAAATGGATRDAEAAGRPDTLRRDGGGRDAAERVVRRLRGMLAGLALATLAFVVVLALTFPTDALVRWALTRALPAGGRAVGFERAHLRPWGLELDGVEVRNPDGTVVIHADWLTLRPSLSGLVGDGHTGRPWHARMGVCAGTVDALADRDTTGDVANVTWTDINLAGCPGRLSL